MAQAYSVVLSAFAFVFGAVVGSFLNVCIYRIPRGISAARGRSLCPHCARAIRASDNIPILSWFLLRGKCRDCGGRISPRYPAVEALCALCFLLCLERLGLCRQTILCQAFAAALIAAAFIDVDTREIPDRFHVVILCLGMAALLFTDGASLAQRLIGAAAVSLPMLLIARFTDGFGMGDIKLTAASGFFLGWQGILFAAFIGCVCAALFAGALIALKKKTKKDKIAFGPYLAIGLFAAALYARPAIAAYLGLFGLD